MERGNVSELGAQMILESTATEEEAIDFALQKFDEKCTPDMKDYQSERLTIPHLIKGAVHEIKNHIGDLYSYQAKVEGVLHEYKFTGYTDFVLENKSTGEKIIVDLKTTREHLVLYHLHTQDKYLCILMHYNVMLNYYT